MEQFVIVADDDLQVLERAKGVIEEEGYIAIVASDGKKAYKALRSNIKMAAVFLDLEMPYITGIELLKYMASVEHLQSVPVVVMDEKADAATLHEALSAGAMASIQKPFNAVKFGAILRTVVGSSSDRPNS